MEQAQEARDQEQAWAEAVVAGARAAVAGEEALPQVRADTVSVPTAGKKLPTSWAAPVMNRNVPNAAPL